MIEDKISNGQIDKMIEPQHQLSGSLIFIKFTKIYSSSLNICSFPKECLSLCLYHTERSLRLDAFVINIHLKKKLVMDFLIGTQGTQGILQTLRWPCEPINLSIRHLESPIEVQLNSWWKTVSLWSIKVW